MGHGRSLLTWIASGPGGFGLWNWDRNNLPCILCVCTFQWMSGWHVTMLHTIATWSELLQITPCERWLWILEQIRMSVAILVSGLWLATGWHPCPLIGQPLIQPRVDMTRAKIVLNRVILTFFAAFLSFLFYPRFSKSLPHKVGPKCVAMTQLKPLNGEFRIKIVPHW